MSNGQTVILATDRQRQLAHALIDRAPANAVLNIREANRTNDQNALLWSLLSELARAKPEGRILSTDVWKCLFMNACGFPCSFEPSLDGKGVVPLGFRSSRLTKAQFSDLIECIVAYAAEHGVRFSDERRAA